MSKSRRGGRAALSVSAGALTAWLAVAGGAWAQSQQPLSPPAAPPGTSTAGSPDPRAATQEIVVTGSRIPRAGFDTLQPAQSVTAATLEDRGFTNVGDALNEVSSFGPAGSNNTGQQSGQNIGQQFVNLYNLGAQRTLVLVNGRRFVSGNAPTPPGTFGGPPAGQEVDLNTIPIGLVDHVEVLTVGGAPIYGADAIAGTVNVILKDKYQGVQAEAQYGVSRQGDGKSYIARVLAGANFAEDRGNFTVAAEYTKQDGLTYADRSTLPYQTQQPSDACKALGYGACLVTNARVPSIFTGGIPTIGATLANSGSPTYPNAIKNAAGQVVAFAPDGSLQPVSLGVQNNGLVFASGGDGDNLRPQSSFVAPVERFLIDGIGHYDLTEHLRLFGEFEYSHVDATQLAAQPSYQSAFFAAQKGQGPLKFTTANPFLSAQAAAVLNAAGASTFYLSRANLDLAPTAFDNQLDTYRVVGGLKGDLRIFDRKVNWDASFNYGRSQGEETYYQIDEANFERAIDVTRDASGQVVCASGMDCRPLNLFGAGAPSQAAREYVTHTDHAFSLLQQRDLQLNATGSPFDLWAGPVRAAVGFEYRVESGSFRSDPFAAAGLGRNPPVTPVSGSYDSKEVYGELNVPLVSSAMGVPLVSSAELDGSFRHIENSYAGGADVFTVGLKYRPVVDVEFRGNITHSVRAPSIEELFLPTTSTNNFAQDPCDPNYINGKANRAGNCATAFAALGASLAGFKSNVVNASVLGSTGGNPNLLNERANAWTAGFVLRPRWAPRLSLALDWINIHLKDPITSLTLTQVMDACYDAGGYPNSFCGLFSRDRTGQVTGYSLPLVNAGAQEFAGAQLDATYNLAVADLPLVGLAGLHPGGEYGRLTFDMNAFFEEKHNNQILGVITKLRGDIGDSKWRVNASGRYTFGPLGLFLQARWIDSAFANVELQRSSQQIFSVGTYWVWNGAVSYDFTKRLTGELTIDNLFNQNPPRNAITLAGGAALSTYDYFGQSFLFKLRAKI